MTADQGTDGARPAALSARPLPPYTFILDGDRLRHLRQQRGLSQNELADQAEVSLTTVGRLERQRHAPCRGWTSAVSPEPLASTPRP